MKFRFIFIVLTDLLTMDNLQYMVYETNVDVMYQEGL